MAPVQPRSKTIVIVAAVAKNRVIGYRSTIPWNLPEDFSHFKKSTIGNTVLMGRTTFDSIGHPLPGRSTIVLTRDRNWKWPGVTVAHDLQDAIEAAEDLPGDLMVAGGSHIYAATISLAHVQVISEIDLEPKGDAYFPCWDKDEWFRESSDQRIGFKITRWHRKPTQMRTAEFKLTDEAASAWWSDDWSHRLADCVRAQEVRTRHSDRINWTSVHQTAMQVIVEAAENRDRPGDAEGLREVRLSRHLSLQDLKAVQGALLHWSAYLAPRRHAT